jgi:hypothetical protein
MRKSNKAKPALPIRGDELAYTVPVARRITGLSHTGIYKLIGSGELKSDLIGGRRLINGPALRQRFGIQPVAAA